MRRKFSICLLLAGVTLAIYWPARHFDVVYYDDPLFVTDNAEIQSGVNWQSFKWAMTSVVAANWHPVTSLSFVLTHQFLGTNPGAEHMVNVMFHAANAVLLFLLLYQLTGRRCGWGDNPDEPNSVSPPSEGAQTNACVLTETLWPCALVAALFAWHPLRVESVAWIAERKDVVSGFFLLLTLWAYAVHGQKAESTNQRVENLTAAHRAPSRLFYWLALLFFALGLMSKAMLVTVPFLLLMLDVWPLGRMANFPKFQFSTLVRLIWEKIPFFALAAVFCGLTYWIQQTHAAMSSLDRLPPGLRLENVIVSYLRYLGKTIWPGEMAAIYPFPVNEQSYLALWPGWQIGLAALVLLGISVLCVRLMSRKPYLAFGWFWYLGTLLPVIGLVQVGGQGMADRYTYIPLIGPVLAAVWWLAELARGKSWKILLTGVAIVALAACAVGTRHQLQYWKSTVALFSHTLEVTGENAFAEFALGIGLEHESRWREALVHHRIALELNPADHEYNLAVARMQEQTGDWAGAAATYEAVIALAPDDFESHLRLATVLPHLGKKREALAQLEAAIQANPDSPEALNNLAWILATSVEADMRNGRRAVEFAEHACELTHYKKTIMVGTLAAAYAEAGRFDDAIATAQKACALAEVRGETGLLQNNRKLLIRYQDHQPYHEVAP